MIKMVKDDVVCDADMSQVAILQENGWKTLKEANASKKKKTTKKPAKKETSKSEEKETTKRTRRTLTGK